MKKIFIFGCNGMLGFTFVKYLYLFSKYKIICISRRENTEFKKFLNLKKSNRISYYNFDLEDIKKLLNLFKKYKPHYVLNCAGKVKKLINKKNLQETIFINSLYPRMLDICALLIKFKLIHFSTDCVFTGIKGNYNEKDNCDADDTYGFSKLLGEPKSSNSIVIRTSIIGHELKGSNRGLLNWFLNQKNYVLGYKNAIFSGLPTIEIAEIVKKYILEKGIIKSGTYNVASKPITKYDLLLKIAKIYKKKIKIKLNYKVKIDRSLNAGKFNKLTRYSPLKWEKLIIKMYQFNELP